MTSAEYAESIGPDNSAWVIWRSPPRLRARPTRCPQPEVGAAADHFVTVVVDMAVTPKATKPSTAAILKALGQDERIEILKCFESADGGGAVEMSAKMLSERLAKPLSNTTLERAHPLGRPRGPGRP
jgi:hypothetical protein